MAIISGGTQIDPHLRRWMLFVDGENLAIRGQRVAEQKGIVLEGGPFYQPDVLLWFPSLTATHAFATGHLALQPEAIRAIYYTSVFGDSAKVEEARGILWTLGFNPEVFKKSRREQKAKGVDIALTKDMLGNAFRDNYDVAVLVAGDGDYVPLVKEVKSLGKVAYVAFFEREGLNPALKIEADRFTDLTSRLHEFTGRAVLQTEMAKWKEKKG